MTLGPPPNYAVTASVRPVTPLAARVTPVRPARYAVR